ncbi:MAG: 50S ribosomal protein L17 [Acidobacteriota bacterium]
MRHNMAHRKLGRTSEHRRALFRNQLRSLIEHERIITTLPKAKELRPIAEKIITLGRQADSVHARRLVGRMVPDRDMIKRLFTSIGPRFVARPGGYTRIVKIGPRRGDGAELAILELVDYKLPEAKAKAAPETKEAKKRKRAAAGLTEAKAR